MTVRLIESIAEMQQLALATRAARQRVVLVPTMGYLHEGHASLMRAGRQLGDLLVTSIFVNPTQFGVGEDFSTYPRDLVRDRELVDGSGVDVIFTPTAAAMYPAGSQTYVSVEELTRPLCGASRPGHFRGVTTVVCKLFGIVQPHVALFGKKDFQQLAVIRQMTADLNLPVEIVGMPIVREADGLAMSSRNAYLSPAERQSALCLSRAIAAVRHAYRAGERQAATLQQLAVSFVAAEQAASIDYIELRDSGTLAPTGQADDRTLLALAVKIGRTRLIDNGVLGEED
jgi:pantoate--beta-alanine ligase